MLNITISDWKGGYLLQCLYEKINKQKTCFYLSTENSFVGGSLNMMLTITLSDWEGGYLLQHCMEKQRKKNLLYIFQLKNSLSCVFFPW